MKKILFGLTLLAALGACKQKSSLQTDRSMVLLSDSGNYNYNGNSDTGYNNQQVVSSGIYGVGSGYSAAAAQPVVNAPVRNTTAPRRASTSTRRSSTSSSGTSSSSGTTASTVPARKKGWSKAAKGAAIGAGAGAVAGAVIGHNAKGAIIGAVLGAGGGYIIGRSKDKKDGRN
ncbi:MAG: YMGG-like glycine zipper-containing protein [Ferruginibacter sp.]